MLSGGRPSSLSTVATILADSALEKPRLRRKSSRSSSFLATMRSRAALMPFTKRIGEESAKFSSAGAASCAKRLAANFERSEEHTSELQSLMRISYAVFCLKHKNTTTPNHQDTQQYKDAHR